MLTLMIIVLFALGIYSVRRLGVVAPATFVLMFSAATVLQMLLASRNQSFLWYTQMALDGSAYAAAGSFALLAVLTLLASTIAMPVVPSTRLRFSLAIKATVRRRIVAYSGIFVPLLFLLCLWHFLNADFKNSWHYVDYMSSRDMAFYGLVDPISAVTHKLLKLFGLIAAALLPMIPARCPFLYLMTLGIVLYALGFNLILGSKYVGLLLGVCAMSYLLASESRYRRPIAMILVMLAAWLVLANFSMRATRQYGLQTLLEQGIFLDDLDQIALIRASHLVFGGANLLQFSLSKPLEFDPLYAALSFSPLVSSIDGYSNYKVVDATTTLMFWENKTGTIWAPVSGFGEAFAFGWPYIIFLYGVIALTARECQKLYNFVGGEITAIPSALLIMGITIITMYPIRNGFRFIFLALIIALILSRWAARRIRRQAQADENSDLPPENWTV